jgi:hypothetical protein
MVPLKLADLGSDFHAVVDVVSEQLDVMERLVYSHHDDSLQRRIRICLQGSDFSADVSAP